MKVFVIMPAAGLGTRMAVPGSAGKKSAASKQFNELAGTPILVHSLRRFAEVPKVTEIWIALRQTEIAGFRERLTKEFGLQDGCLAGKKVELVEGGEHRQQSVANALNAIKANADDVVLVHDAVRPLVSAEIIEEVLMGVERHGGAIAGLPAVDTIKQVERTADGAMIHATLPRERIVLAQTPQGFRYALLKNAFDMAAADGFLGTDEASLVEHAGDPVAVVMGSPRNIKITTPADMELAEFYFRK